MTHDAFYVAPHVVIAALYLLLARRVWLALSADAGAAGALGAARGGLDLWALPVLAIGHGVLLAILVFGGGEFRFGFALALSATLWLTVLILWLEGLFVPLRGLQPLVLPAAAVALVLPLVFPGTVVQAAERGIALRLHLLVAILAYSLLTIAALHAVLMAALDRRLHAGAAGAESATSRLFRQAPPLLAMERLLFRLIGAGFVLLTATVLSGVLFSEYLFGRALRFEHKTVFALAAWLVFGGLLAGRLVFGWRGRVALRWTLAGFVMLLLAYVGSRFVVEVILSRG
jgi:ABC-type uncharacterized transport system permease subunit